MAWSISASRTCSTTEWTRRSGWPADRHLRLAAVADVVGTPSPGILHLALCVCLNAADRPLGVVPNRHCQPLGVPRAGLLAPQDDHDFMVLKLIRPANVAEVGDVSVSVLAADWQFDAGFFPGQSAADPLVRHHQRPSLPGHPSNEPGDRRKACRGPPFRPVLTRWRPLYQAVAKEREIPHLMTRAFRCTRISGKSCN